MSRSRFSPLRFSGALLWSASLILFAGLVVPLIHANRFRQGIREALENALGRQVEIGDVTLNLLSGPGFQLHNVVMGEDPAFGAEHFAYMESMQARLRLRTLWTGQVQLASLTLIEPSINLVKNPGGRWNFEALLARAGAGKQAGASATNAYFPYIGIQDGRVNFKFGDYKSVFHFQDVEAALSPARDAEGGWSIRFAGRPARTDHLLSGMGRLTGDGELRAATGMVRLDLALETSPMEYLLILVYGRDFGVHGNLGARARLNGEVSAIQIQGTLQAGDIHRWDIVPSQESRFAAAFVGRLNLPGQQLEMETDPSGAHPPAVRVRFAIDNFLSAPQWRAALQLNRAPADPVIRTARHLGVAFPAGMELRGSIQGHLDFPGSLWPRGVLNLEEGQVLLQDCPPVSVGLAEIELEGPAFRISPAVLRLGRQALEISASGRLDQVELEMPVTARGVRLEEVQEYIQAVKPGGLGWLSSGYWDGRVVFRKQPGQPGLWSGSGTLSKARWQPRGLESPVELAQARVRWEARAAHLENLSGALGETRFSGSCRHSLDAAPGERETSCRMRIAELDLGRLDRWWNPRQKRSRWDIWRRALGKTTPATPSWLQTAKIQGSVTVGNLRLGKWAFTNVRSELAWRGESLELKALRAELGRGLVTGEMRAEFSGAQPRYSLKAALRGADLKSLCGPAALPANIQRGAMDLKLGLVTTGRTAEELRAGLRATGSFEGHSITLENVEWNEAAADSDGTVEIRSLEGRFEWSRNGLELSALRMGVGKEVYQGHGSIGGRPPVLLEVASRGRQSRLVGAGVEDVTTGVP